MRPLRLVAALVLLAVVLAAGVYLRQPTFPADVTEFLPVDSEAASIAREITRSSLSQRVVILISGESKQANRAVARQMAEQLQTDALFASADAGPPTMRKGGPESIHELYFPYRYNFVSAAERELERLDSAAGMAAKAREFAEALNGRYATLLHRLGPRDPLLAYVGILERLSDIIRSGLTVVDGQYQTSDGDGVVLATTRAGAFDAGEAARVGEAIDAAFQNASDPKTSIRVSGMYRYTAAISGMIKRDIQRVTAISLIGIVLIFGLFLGRIRTALLPLASIGIGGGIAFAVTVLVFGKVHLLTIAFGVSLIGVCVDYSVHYLNHAGVDSHGVWRSIRTGALTTIAGFVVLFTSSVEALDQIALFSSVGVAAAVLATWLLAGAFFQRKVKTPRHRRTLDRADRLVASVRARPIVGAILAAPVIGCAIVGLPQLSFEGDIDAIDNPMPELREVDDEVQRRVAGVRSSDLVVVRAADQETALRYNDVLAGELKDAVQAGALTHFTSLHNVVWSAETQQMNRQFFAEREASLTRHMAKAFDAVGVRSGMLEPVKEGFDLRDDVLTLEDIRESDLGPISDLFDPHGTGRMLVTYLGGVEDVDALKERITGVEGAFWLRQRESLDDAWRTLGEEVVRAALLGLLAIALVAFGAYRDPRAVAVALAPTLLATVGTVGFLSLLGIAVGPTHGLALLLVIAIAADYGVMLEAHHDRAAALSVSVGMAYLSTMFSFGALILSEHPVLHAFGITIAVGVTFAMLLLPGIDRLLTRPPIRSDGGQSS